MTAVIGHMPFAGHRTCAEWAPKVEWPANVQTQARHDRSNAKRAA